MADGPLGIASWGLFGRATAYPSALSLAASWNRDLATTTGQAFADGGVPVESILCLLPVSISIVPQKVPAISNISVKIRGLPLRWLWHLPVLWPMAVCFRW